MHQLQVFLQQKYAFPPMIVDTDVAAKLRVPIQQNQKTKVEVKALFFAATRKKLLCNSTC